MAQIQGALPFQHNVARRFGDLIAEYVEATRARFHSRPSRPKRQHYPELRPSFVESAAMQREMYRL